MFVVFYQYITKLPTICVMFNHFMSSNPFRRQLHYFKTKTKFNSTKCILWLKCLVRCIDGYAFRFLFARKKPYHLWPVLLLFVSIACLVNTVIYFKRLTLVVNKFKWVIMIALLCLKSPCACALYLIVSFTKSLEDKNIKHFS